MVTLHMGSPWMWPPCLSIWTVLVTSPIWWESGTWATSPKNTLPPTGGLSPILDTGLARRTTTVMSTKRGWVVDTHTINHTLVTWSLFLQNLHGYDFRHNMTVSWDEIGTYATDLFTLEAEKIISNHDTEQPLFLYLSHLAVHSGNCVQPLQAPQEAIDKHSYIQEQNRRNFSGMVTKLDESVGKVCNIFAAFKQTFSLYLILRWWACCKKRTC